MRRDQGITVLEVAIGLAVATVLAGAAMAGVKNHQQGIAAAWSRLEASQCAAARLEVLRAEPSRLAVGEAPFPTPMRGAVGLERVRLAAPGLYEVEVEVRHPSDAVRVVLATLVVREGTP